jgi:hypothetical protein
MNLSQLIQEAIERFEDQFEIETDIWGGGTAIGLDPEIKLSKLKDFIETELTQIVKESFKNTRVEEAVVSVTSLDMIPINAGGALQVASNFGRNQALSDKHNKECEFLGN